MLPIKVPKKLSGNMPRRISEKDCVVIDRLSFVARKLSDSVDPILKTFKHSKPKLALNMVVSAKYKKVLLPSLPN